MGKVLFALAALAAIWLLPSSAVAQAREATDADREAVPSVAIEDDEVSGQLLQVAPGRITDGPVRPAGFDWEMDEDGWGIREHRLYVAPRRVQQMSMEQMPRRPETRWPGENLERAHAFADSYAFPRLYPTVGGAYQVAVGGAGGDGDGTIFTQRVDVDLYLLRLGLSLHDDLEGSRGDRQFLDVDLRIPIGLGERMRLALIPGVSFPAQDPRTQDESNVRFQAAFGVGAPGGSLELRGGVTEGGRPAGVLLGAEALRVNEPAALFGVLGALRLARVVELRGEIAGEVASGGTDLLSLMPGAAFYPLGDERLEIGTVAVIESRGQDLGLSEPATGLLLRLGLNVL